MRIDRFVLCVARLGYWQRRWGVAAGVLLAFAVGGSSRAGAQLVTGTITDAAGSPLPGAEVRLVTTDGQSVLRADTIRGTRTHFTLRAPAKHTGTAYLVEACAEGYAPAFTRIAEVPPGRDTLVLRAALAHAAERGHVPLGTGPCEWETRGEMLELVRGSGFAGDATRVQATLERAALAAPRDTGAVDAYWHGRVNRYRDSLAAARTSDARARAAYMAAQAAIQLRTWGKTAADSTLRVQMLAALRPDSRWWLTTPSLTLQNVVELLFALPDRRDTSATAIAKRRLALPYVDSLVSGIAEPDVQSQARLMLAALAYGVGDSARAQLALTRMLREQPNYLAAKLATYRYPSLSALRVGQPFPVFDLPLLPDTTRGHLTNADLRGHARFTVVAFWGTWCAPCIREIPTLDTLYRTYHARGLEIVSIAADESPAAVNRFRQTRYAMPWRNAFAGTTQDPALLHMGIFAYPTAVIVDNTGTIVAVQLFGSPEELAAKVQKLFD